MVTLEAFVAYLDHLLTPKQFVDYCPNGLQIEGKPVIETLVTGVTANLALLEAAIAHNADALLVHHGFFWKNDSPCITGMSYRRIRTLITHGMSLLAYHLPLDAHEVYGNNVQLGQRLDALVTDTFQSQSGINIGCIGQLRTPMSGEQLAKWLTTQLERAPLYISGSKRPIETLAWCTGAGQDYIWQALENKVDAYLTGEVSERTVHIARENNLHFYAAGHHATERYGVKALGDHLSSQFGIQHHFIDIDNPV